MVRERASRLKDGQLDAVTLMAVIESMVQAISTLRMTLSNIQSIPPWELSVPKRRSFLRREAPNL